MNERHVQLGLGEANAGSGRVGAFLLGRAVKRIGAVGRALHGILLANMLARRSTNHHISMVDVGPFFILDELDRDIDLSRTATSGQWVSHPEQLAAI